MFKDGKEKRKGKKKKKKARSPFALPVKRSGVLMPFGTRSYPPPPPPVDMTSRALQTKNLLGSFFNCTLTLNTLSEN